MHEGVGNGFDNEVLELIYDKINIPFVMHGGAGNANHIHEVLKLEKVSGVAISSLLHYSLIRDKIFKLEKKTEGNTEFIRNLNDNFSYEKVSILSIKKFLKKKQVQVRL